ncbi:hypothetical protein BGZ91_003751 [Linnemannia elongata]|nr:hypothetical protein BGZ91_003751 [Linnemannia elongata]KAG0075984.1 hypothetical protein BGZ90_009259 [Linnemannia elongata]
MPRHAASQPQRLQSGPEVDVDTLSPNLTAYYLDASPWSPQFHSLQKALQVVSLNHARGKVSDTELPLNYRGPSFTPVKTTQGGFCCITGVAFQDERNGPEAYGYVVEKGDLNYILQPEPTDTNTPVDGSKTYNVCAKAKSKTQYIVRPRDLPAPQDCPTSCRGLYERAVDSVHGRRTPAPLTIQSPLPQPPTASTILHGDEFCRPLDNTITTVSCRVPCFTDSDFGHKQIQKYVVIEFSLISGGWLEDNRRYTIPVSVDDQCYPLEFTELSYSIFYLRESVLSRCWVSGVVSNVPTDPASLSCKNTDTHAPALDNDNTSSRPLSKTKTMGKAKTKTMDKAKDKAIVKPYVCPYPDCTKAFTKKGNQMTHSIKHYQKFTCATCSCTFSQQTDLDRHYRNVHLGWRWKCNQCSRLFTRESVAGNHPSCQADEQRPGIEKVIVPAEECRRCQPSEHQQQSQPRQKRLCQ